MTCPPETLATALAGVDRLVLISGNEVGQRVGQHSAVIEAAKAAGVRLIAYTSILRAATSPLPLAVEHKATEEVLALSEPLAEFGGMYATHLRSEFADILEAMDEAFRIGKHARVPVVISHLKCAGVENWGRSEEVLAALVAGWVPGP